LFRSSDQQTRHLKTPAADSRFERPLPRAPTVSAGSWRSCVWNDALQEPGAKLQQCSVPSRGRTNLQVIETGTCPLSSAADQQDPREASSAISLSASFVKANLAYTARTLLRRAGGNGTRWSSLQAGWSLDLVKKTSSRLLQISEMPENVLLKHSFLK